MDSSLGIANPALSVWIFALLAGLTGAQTPIEVARSVAGMNGLAFVSILLFA